MGRGSTTPQLFEISLSAREGGVLFFLLSPKRSRKPRISPAVRIVAAILPRRFKVRLAAIIASLHLTDRRAVLSVRPDCRPKFHPINGTPKWRLRPCPGALFSNFFISRISVNVVLGSWRSCSVSDAGQILLGHLPNTN